MDHAPVDSTKEATPLRIIEHSGENTKRMRSFEVIPDPTLQVVMGDNAQGKTSYMDSIVWALCGASAVPDKPIRDNEISANCELKLGNGETIHYVVTRTFEQGKASKISIVTGEGKKVGSPQNFLDALLGNFNFDPVSFMRMKASDQRDALLELPSVGIDFDAITKIDQQDALKRSQRTQLGRDRDEAKGAFTSMQSPPGGLPKEEVSIAELSVEHEQAMDLQKNADGEHRELIRMDELVSSYDDKIQTLKGQLQKAKDERVEHQGKVVEQRDKCADADKAVVDIEAIKAKMATAEETNTQIRNAAARTEKKKRYDDKAQQYKDMTTAIKALADKKEKILGAAEFPLDDLTFNEHGVIFQGQPLNQGSSAEQLKVAMAIGMAGNPQIRVMTIPDASLLDNDSMKAIAVMAAEHEFQVFAERVGKTDEVGIVIEDGGIIETRARVVPKGENDG